MPDITIVVPVAPYHIQRLPRALASIRAQSIPCETVVIYDEDAHGAGWARNEGLKQVTTPLVVFLDADDELLPEFAAKTLAIYRQTGRYVYTDFTDGKGVRYHTSECPWMDKRWHAVTALLPSDWVREVSGFDETMEYAEDTEFFAHLTRSGYCGVRLPEVLFTYHRGGQRSQQGRDDAVRERIMQEINARYQEKIMGCCGNNAPVVPLPSGQSVKVRPAWGFGKRTYIGSVTRKHYGRIDSGYVIDIDPRDLARRPDLFTVVEQPIAVPAPVNGDAAKADDEPSRFKAFAQKLRRVWFSEPSRAQTPVVLPETPMMVDAEPDVDRIIDFARKVYVREQVGEYGIPAVHIQREPVFVFPDKDYPSYTDVRRLVELSGFEWRTYEHWTDNYDTNGIYVFLTPEQPWSMMPARERFIWWSLEYGGEYEPDLSHWHGEVWASDPAWAATHGAQMVVMGSHPGLRGSPELSRNTRLYDVLMLAYMTPRREQLRHRILADGLSTPAEIYPGYGLARDEQLENARLMLHAHQDDARRAIAPQRFALCAAYHLPLIHESVPDAGEYADYAMFADYAALSAVTRDYLTGRFDDPLRTPLGERLHQWLCVDNTFRKSVLAALKG